MHGMQFSTIEITENGVYIIMQFLKISLKLFYHLLFQIL